MSFFLGYATLNRFYPPDLPQLSDTYYYFHVVQNGFKERLSDDFGASTRFLIPGLANLLYFSIPDLGSWNKAALSILLVNSGFVAGIACLTFFSAVKFTSSATTGLIAAFVLMLNYQTTNIFLAGYVESGFCFFILAFVILSYYGKYYWLPFVCILGTLTKEVFLPFVLSYSFCFILMLYIQTRKVSWQVCASHFLCGFLSVLCYFYLKFLAVGDIVSPFEHAAQIHKGTPPLFSNFFGTFLRFSYVFIWLLPLALPKIREIPAGFIFPVVGALIPLLVLGTIAGLSGVGYARITFSVLGPLLCVAAAISLNRIFASKG